MQEKKNGVHNKLLKNNKLTSLGKNEMHFLQEKKSSEIHPRFYLVIKTAKLMNIVKIRFYPPNMSPSIPRNQTE